MLKKRIISVLTALMAALAVWLTVPAAASGNGDYSGQLRYVIVIDASEKSDRGEVCAAACETILNLLPEENAQIGVIAYGYIAEVGDEYVYSSVEQPRKEAQYIHQLLPLEQAGAVDSQMLYGRIVQAFASKEKTSPHGQALLAGVDMLVAADTAEGEGCIIWLSDGIRVSEEWGIESSCRDAAVKAAAENGWPIYPVQLDYGEAGGSSAEEMMKGIAETTQAGNGRAVQFQTIDMHTMASGEERKELPLWAFQKGLLGIMPGSSWEETPSDGMVALPCTVQNLTCEYVVAFVGEDLNAVSVEIPDEGTVFYTESRDDGDIVVKRVADCFVVRLRFPVPADWTINAHGGKEKLKVYRWLHRAVDINFVAENEMAEMLPAGDTKNMDLDRTGKIDFAASYAYHDRMLDISQVDSAMTATLEIQVKRPGNNTRYRNLETVGMQVKGQSHRTVESVSLEKLAERETELYQEQTRTYRARIVLEWQDEEPQRIYGDWFLFGAKNTFIERLCQEPMELQVTANDMVNLPLEQYIANEDGDPLIYELITKNGPADQFALTDENGGPLMKQDEKGNLIPNECLLSDIWIKATPYVGEYELYLHVWDGEKHNAFRIDLEVLPYPEDKPESVPVEKRELNDVPGWLKRLCPHFDIGEGSAEYRETMDKKVLDVCVVGKDADKVTWSYDKATRQLVIRPTEAGLVELGLQMAYDAFEPDGKGGYTNQVCERPVELDVTSRFAMMKCQAGLWLFIGSVFAWIAVRWVRKLISQRKFPEGMCCTMVLQENGENGGQTVSAALSLQVAALGSTNVTIAELISKLKDNGNEIGQGEGLADKYDIQEWFDDNDVILKNDQLKRIHLKGMHPQKKTYRITGLSGKDGTVQVRLVGERDGDGSEAELTAHNCSIPVSQGLSITVATSNAEKIEVVRHNNVTEKKNVGRILIEIIPKP